LKNVVECANVANRDYDCDEFHPRRFAAPFLYEQAIVRSVTSLCDRNKTLDEPLSEMFARSVHKLRVVKEPLSVYNPIDNVHFVARVGSTFLFRGAFPVSPTAKSDDIDVLGLRHSLVKALRRENLSKNVVSRETVLQAPITLVSLLSFSKRFNQFANLNDYNDNDDDGGGGDDDDDQEMQDDENESSRHHSSSSLASVSTPDDIVDNDYDDNLIELERNDNLIEVVEQTNDVEILEEFSAQPENDENNNNINNNDSNSIQKITRKINAKGHVRHNDDFRLMREMNAANKHPRLSLYHVPVVGSSLLKLDPDEPFVRNHLLRSYRLWNPDRLHDVVALLDKLMQSNEDDDQVRFVYVHCQGGVDRTGAVIIAYMIRHGVPLWAALTLAAMYKSNNGNGFKYLGADRVMVDYPTNPHMQSIRWYAEYLEYEKTHDTLKF